MKINIEEFSREDLIGIFYLGIEESTYFSLTYNEYVYFPLPKGNKKVNISIDKVMDCLFSGGSISIIDRESNITYITSISKIISKLNLAIKKDASILVSLSKIIYGHGADNEDGDKVIRGMLFGDRV